MRTKVTTKPAVRSKRHHERSYEISRRKPGSQAASLCNADGLFIWSTHSHLAIDRVLQTDQLPPMSRSLLVFFLKPLGMMVTQESDRLIRGFHAARNRHVLRVGQVQFRLQQVL